MSYGDPEWAGWVVGQEECDKHVQKFWEHGGNANNPERLGIG